MKPKPNHFTPENVHCVLRVMLQAVGLEIGKPLEHTRDERIFIHNKLNIIVAFGKNAFPEMGIYTIHENLLMEISFSSSDVTMETIERKKLGSGELPSDMSMVEALTLYIRMREAANFYIGEHFDFPRVLIQLPKKNLAL